VWLLISSWAFRHLSACTCAHLVWRVVPSFRCMGHCRDPGAIRCTHVLTWLDGDASHRSRYGSVALDIDLYLVGLLDGEFVGRSWLAESWSSELVIRELVSRSASQSWSAKLVIGRDLVGRCAIFLKKGHGPILGTQFVSTRQQHSNVRVTPWSCMEAFVED
jgi:hypothetical protein